VGDGDGRLAGRRGELQHGDVVVAVVLGVDEDLRDLDAGAARAQLVGAEQDVDGGREHEAEHVVDDGDAQQAAHAVRRRDDGVRVDQGAAAVLAGAVAGRDGGHPGVLALGREAAADDGRGGRRGEGQQEQQGAEDGKRAKGHGQTGWLGAGTDCKRMGGGTHLPKASRNAWHTRRFPPLPLPKKARRGGFGGQGVEGRPRQARAAFESGLTGPPHVAPTNRRSWGAGAAAYQARGPRAVPPMKLLPARPCKQGQPVRSLRSPRSSPATSLRSGAPL